MPIFAVVSPEKPKVLGQRIAELYGDNQLPVDAHVWLVSDAGTSQSVSEKIGLGNNPALGGALVVGVSGYFGFKPPTVWEWIKAKWGGTSG